MQYTTIDDVTFAVHSTLDNGVSDHTEFDVAGIIDETYDYDPADGYVSTVDEDEYWTIVQAHALQTA